MKKQPTILVTGGTGLVGSALKRLGVPNMFFADRSHADLTDRGQTERLFAKVKPDQVIHLAAHVGGVGGNSRHPGEYFRDNILINTNVLEVARLNKVDRLLSFLSTCIFPDKCDYPLKAEYLHNGPPHSSNFGYAHAKRMLEVQSRAYRSEWGCDFITVVGTNIYGPNDNFSLDDGHAVAALIHRCFLARKNKTDLTVWGSGAPLREFVLADDVARLTMWAIENYNEEKPLIFSSGIETSIKDLTNLIAKKMQFTGKIIFDDKKPDGQLRKPSDSATLKKLLPDFKFTKPEDGIEKTVTWFVGNYPDIRK